MKPFFFALIIAVAGTHAAHLSMNKSLPKSSIPIKETLPSIKALKLLSLNYKNVVADYYWLRAISHFGTKKMHKHHYPNLEAMVERVLNLDPYFGQAYYFTGTALTTTGNNANIDTAIELLRSGMTYRPNDYNVGILLGFSLYFSRNEKLEAAQAFSHAATLPGCPDYIGKIATRIASESEDPRIGVLLIDNILENIVDEKLRSVYEERRQLLQLEVELRALQNHIDHFQKQHTRPPSSLQELSSSGLLNSLPSSDPLGGDYFINSDGKVSTTSEDKRLRVYKSSDSRPAQSLKEGE